MSPFPAAGSADPLAGERGDDAFRELAMSLILSTIQTAGTMIRAERVQSPCCDATMRGESKMDFLKHHFNAAFSMSGCQPTQTAESNMLRRAQSLCSVASLWFILWFVLGATPARANVEVDLELVIAVDISYSMDYDELRLQRDGYVTAFRSEAIQKAVRSGPIGKIAITYVEWAGSFEQRIIVPWMVVEGKETAEQFAERIVAAPIRRAYRTSIAGLLDFVTPSFDTSGYQGARRVIDISGDGPNNQGRLVLQARADTLAKGITINGLPVVLKRPGYYDMEDLEQYYRDCVIGGRGAFMIPIRSAEEFREATRTKLLLEISDLQPPEPLIKKAQVEKPRRADCEVGERMWRERWERR
jgi:hypothetical protein